MRTFVSLLSLAMLVVSAGAAFACSGGSITFNFAPAGDGVLAAPEGVVAFTMEFTGPEAPSRVDDSLPDVVVRQGEVEVPGTVSAARYEGEEASDDTFVWRADSPLVPGLDYDIEASVLASWSRGQDPFTESRQARFTVGEAPAPALRLPRVTRATASRFLEEVGVDCYEGGDCGEECTDTESVVVEALLLDLERGDDGLVSRHEVTLRYGPAIDELEEVRRRSGARSVLAFRVDLDFAGWPSDQVCYAFTVRDPLGDRVDSEPACVSLPSDAAPPADAEPGAMEPAENDQPAEPVDGPDEDDGCAATGAPGQVTWLIFALFARRRRRA